MQAFEQSYIDISSVICALLMWPPFFSGPYLQMTYYLRHDIYKHIDNFSFSTSVGLAQAHPNNKYTRQMIIAGASLSCVVGGILNERVGSIHARMHYVCVSLVQNAACTSCAYIGKREKRCDRRERIFFCTHVRLSLWITTYLRMRRTTPPVYLELRRAC